MEWISIKDRLPEDNGRLQMFLVCRNQPSATSGNVLIETEYFTKRFNGADNITHWMPLPEKPKNKYCLFCNHSMSADAPDGSQVLVCFECKGFEGKEIIVGEDECCENYNT